MLSCIASRFLLHKIRHYFIDTYFIELLSVLFLVKRTKAVPVESTASGAHPITMHGMWVVHARSDFPLVYSLIFSYLFSDLLGKESSVRKKAVIRLGAIDWSWAYPGSMSVDPNPVGTGRWINVDSMSCGCVESTLRCNIDAMLIQRCQRWCNIVPSMLSQFANSMLDPHSITVDPLNQRWFNLQIQPKTNVDSR